MQSVWGYDASVATRTLDTHLWRLRKKIGDNDSEKSAIRNFPGFGYALAERPLPIPLVASSVAVK